MTGGKFNDSVFDWASKIGNLPRYLLREHEFTQRLKDVDDAVKTLSSDLVKKTLNSNGLADGQVNLLGTVFALSAHRVWDDDVGEPVQIGYDGEEGVIYTMPSLSLMCNYVFQQVVGTNRECILSYWGAISKSERSEMGEAVENLVWDDLKSRNLFRTWSMQSQKRDDPPNLTIFLTMRVCCTMADLKGVFASCNELVRMEPNTPLIDFAGPGRCVYQATISADHSMSLVGLQKVLEVAGYMQVTGNTYKMVDDSTLPKLNFYWVVPHEKFGAWTSKKQKTVNNKEISLALKTYVNQFVLSVDIKPPTSADMAEFLGTGSQPEWMGVNAVNSIGVPDVDK
jgi:hypothetical protein